MSAETKYCLVIVEANHADNQFYTLGGAGFLTRKEQLSSFTSTPGTVHDCDADDRCYILDVTGPDGWSVEQDKEISEETAKLLLGVDSLDELRDQAKQDNRIIGDLVARS